MLCVPRPSVEIVNPLTPLPFSAELPSKVVPSKKVTVPVGVPVALGLTVAVKVTGCPSPEEFAEDDSAVLVPAA